MGERSGQDHYVDHRYLRGPLLMGDSDETCMADRKDTTACVRVGCRSRPVVQGHGDDQRSTAFVACVLERPISIEGCYKLFSCFRGESKL